jgi:hypothetical protein
LEWYTEYNRRLASKPPAYVVERISDLRHALDVSKTSPSTARIILNRLVAQLSVHRDNEYVNAIEDASKAVVDNPVRARSIIAYVVQTMISDKDAHDSQKTNTWKWKKKI